MNAYTLTAALLLMLALAVRMGTRNATGVWDTELTAATWVSLLLWVALVIRLLALAVN